jgi:proline racemase
MELTRCITVVGCHAEGEVGRVITGGVLPPPGASVFEQQRHLEANADWLRRYVLFEPRGGAFVHANLIVPAKDARAQAGFIVMEATDYPPMSGTNSMCVTKVLLETGMLPMQEPTTRLVLETPGGLIESVAHVRDRRVERITVRNVPSFVHGLDLPVEVKGLGTVNVDIAYGGAFFALVDARRFGLHIRPDEAREMVELGERIKTAVAQAHLPVHPEQPQIRGVTFTQFVLPLERDGATKVGRNAVVISPGKLDRSPCGTGTSARLAVLHARGEIQIGEPYRSVSLLDSRFECEIVRSQEVGARPAIVPSFSGRAWITGVSHYGLEPGDPFPDGYTLSDTWYRAL